MDQNEEVLDLSEEALQRFWDEHVPAPAEMTMSLGQLRMLVSLAIRHAGLTGYVVPDYMTQALDQLKDKPDNTLVTISR